MKVIIKEVTEEGQKYHVNFSTEYGNACALWIGEKPQINKEYFVEFEIPDVLCWQKDIIFSDKEECTIGMQNNKFCFIGVFESIEDDGYTVIRLGDNIISIETQGEPPDLGSNVKITANNLLLYDVNY